MRNLPIALVATSALAALPAPADAAEVSMIRGGAAIASFEQVSDDGCVTTFGEVAVVEVIHGDGELATGLYVTGMSEDTCAGTGNGFAGFAEGDLDVVGLVYARFTGGVVAASYSGGAPVTIELDLRWLGQGAVSHDGGSFHDEFQIDFACSLTRAAATWGDFTIDGDDVTVTSALLGQQASGHIGF